MFREPTLELRELLITDPEHEVGNRLDIALLADRRGVLLDRLDRDDQEVRDLLLSVAGDRMSENLDLAVSQPALASQVLQDRNPRRGCPAEQQPRKEPKTHLEWVFRANDVGPQGVGAVDQLFIDACHRPANQSAGKPTCEVLEETGPGFEEVAAGDAEVHHGEGDIGRTPGHLEALQVGARKQYLDTTSKVLEQMVDADVVALDDEDLSENEDVGG